MKQAINAKTIFANDVTNGKTYTNIISEYVQEKGHDKAQVFYDKHIKPLFDNRDENYDNASEKEEDYWIAISVTQEAAFITGFNAAARLTAID